MRTELEVRGGPTADQSETWVDPLLIKLVEGIFRLLAFQWPVGYGLYPGFALQILFASIIVFALVYLVPLSKSGIGGIHRVWPEDRLEARSSRAQLVAQAEWSGCAREAGGG